MSLHLLEEVCVGSAHCNIVLDSFEPDSISAGKGTGCGVDCHSIYNGSPVDAPELIGIKLFLEFLYGHPDQKFSLKCPDSRIFLSGFKIIDVIDGNEPNALTMQSLNPLQIL